MFHIKTMKVLDRLVLLTCTIFCCGRKIQAISYDSNDLNSGVNGMWGEWYNDDCTAFCGRGVQDKTRICNNPLPERDGKTCPCDDKNVPHKGTTCNGWVERITKQCNIHPCRGYISIVEGGYCTGSNGELLSKCVANDEKNQSECQTDCSSMEACVGYQIDLDYHYCSLYTAVENSCPSGYEFNEEENLALTLGDLKSKKGYYGHYGDYSSRCYGKICQVSFLKFVTIRTNVVRKI